jgi:hypothetical protein
MISGKIVLLGAAALALALGSSKKAKAATSSTSSTPGGVGPDWQAELALAVASGDPAKIRAVADRMAAAGLTAQAQIAREYAAGLGKPGAGGATAGELDRQAAAAKQAAVDAAKAGDAQSAADAKAKGDALAQAADLARAADVAAATAAELLASGAAAAELERAARAAAAAGGKAAAAAGAAVEPDAKRARAEALALHLRGAKRYKEDRVMVKLVQAGEGLTADGMYGASVATMLGQRYSIIPPVPFYWNKKTWAKDKATYKAFLTHQAQIDPARSAQWLGAIKGVDAS